MHKIYLSQLPGEGQDEKDDENGGEKFQDQASVSLDSCQVFPELRLAMQHAVVGRIHKRVYPHNHFFLRLNALGHPSEGGSNLSNPKK